MSIHKLLEISSAAIAATPVGSMAERPGSVADCAWIELQEILSARNGFFAFESAFCFYPATQSDENAALNSPVWNSAGLWRDAYGRLMRDVYFFAEDIFANQFYLDEAQVGIFDSETATYEALCPTLADFTALILKDYSGLCGYQFAHDWQVVHGALPLGKRLAPKQPFVFGGKYEIKNLYAADRVRLMRFRGDIALQIENLPDGASIELRVLD